MKQTKFSLLLLLAFVTLATRSFAQAVGSTFTVDNIRYTITNNDLVNHTDNRVAIADIGGSGAVTVPSTVKHPQSLETYKVTESTPWTNCSKTITSLTFSEGYIKMGNGCYRSLTNLQKVTLPASFTTLGHSCFENCPVFTTYEVAGGSTTFAHNSNGWLLSKDGKTLVSFPSGIAGDVEIPEGITTLATTAFKVYRKVGKVTIPASLITIDQTTNASLYAVGNYFEVNANNPAFQDIDGVLCSKDGKTLIAFPPHYDKTKLGTDGKYTIPNSVEKIGSEAFCQTEDFLKTVDLNNTKQLANEAFLWTNGLETVNIGKYVSKIENGAFLNCPVLAQFTVDTDNTTYSGKDGMIYSKDATKLILCPTGKTGEYVIPERTISVEDKAFYGSKLSKITFPSTLKSVGSEGFRFSTISQLDFGTDSHLETIYGTAFAGTQLAGTITIPASVSRIDGRIFHGTNVSSIHIADGSQLTEIKQQGFDELAELESFVFDGTNSVTKIGVEAFANCPKLKSFEIPAGVTNIYNGAFLNTPLLETIIFKEPAAITVIGKGAFGGSGIKNISLPESVTTIEEQAFDNCKNLTTIDIPKNVSDIQTGAFNFCI